MDIVNNICELTHSQMLVVIVKWTIMTTITISEFIDNLTASQATIISSIISAIIALVIVLTSRFIDRRKVK